MSTQSKLSKLIKQTPLNEKLLSRPPFKYLHDLINEVIEKTGFGKEIYSETERNSENVKTKESKLQFLQKIIEYTRKVSGKEIKAKPSKIIAGLEAEDTCEFLVLLVETALKHQNLEAPFVASSSNNKIVANVSIDSSSGSAESNFESEKPGKKTLSTDSLADGSILKVKPRNLPEKELSKANSKQAISPKKVERITSRADFKDKNTTEIKTVSTNSNDRSDSQMSIATSDAPGERLTGLLNAIDSSVVRPMTAVRRQSTAKEFQSKPDTSGVEDNEEYVVITSPSQPVESLLLEDEGKSSAHGKLVKTILETNKVLSVSDSSKYQTEGKTGTEKEAFEIKNYIQSISRTIAPLGVILDHLQEDFDEMEKEYDYWHKEEQSYKVQLEEAKKETKKLAEGFEGKLDHLDDLIREQVMI